MVSIKGLDKAEVIAALYNNSAPQGMGIFQARPGRMTPEQAREAFIYGDDLKRMFPRAEEICAPEGIRFDYLYGRPLKILITDEGFEPRGYDRDNGGEGTAQRIIDELRAQKQSD